MMEKRILQILKEVQKENVQDGCCYYCRKPMGGAKRTQKYHSQCVWDAKKYGIKAKFKNHNYMYVYLGTGYDRGQGRRSGSMVKGAMSVAQDQWSDPVPVTVKNVTRSLNSHKYKINLCNGSWVRAKDAMLLAKYLDENPTIN